MNLYIKTICDAYQRKEKFGHQIVIEDDAVCLVWNDRNIEGLNKIHCEKYNPALLKLAERLDLGNNFGIAIYEKEIVEHPDLQYCGITRIMGLEVTEKYQETAKCQIMRVEGEDKLKVWSSLACEIFEMQKYQENLYYSVLPDLQLQDDIKYLAYVDGKAVGIAAIGKGNNADVIEWVGVLSSFRRQGICRALLQHAINCELDNGCGKFVLSSSEMGYKAYQALGFKVIFTRHNYKIKRCRDD